MVVDDDFLLRTMLRDVLEDADPSWIVEDRGFGMDAIFEVGLQPFDLIITDIRMSGLSGFDVVKEVGAMEKPVPVIVVSGETRADIAEKALESGAKAFISKPFEAEALVAKVRELL